MRSIQFACSCVSVLASSLALAGPFVVGDAIHVTAASGYGSNANKPAIIRISSSPLAISPLVIDGGFTGIGAYDSFRQSVIALRFGIAMASVNSSGVVSGISLAGSQDASAVAPTGDGRIYVQRATKWSYIDAANATHDLNNVANAALFKAPRVYKRAFFDMSTNAIFAGTIAASGAVLAKIPLAPDGSHVSAPVTEITLSTPGLSDPDVVGISPGPNNKLFIKIDDNGGGLGPRMILLDPVAMTQSTYAQSNYFGIGGEIAGCYVPNLNAALVVDSLADQLRLFSLGASGAGTPIAGTGGISSSGGFSGETATTFPITASACPCDLNHDTLVDDSDFTIFLAAYNILDCADPSMAAGCPSDFTHDGLVEDADFSLFVMAYNELICP
ncbi:MAG: hypothetical protein U0570_01215 [Phycisphaerales bacterium]